MLLEQRERDRDVPMDVAYPHAELDALSDRAIDMGAARAAEPWRGDAIELNAIAQVGSMFVS